MRVEQNGRETIELSLWQIVQKIPLRHCALVVVPGAGDEQVQRQLERGVHEKDAWEVLRYPHDGDQFKVPGQIEKHQNIETSTH
jgi:hypothetical protein